MIVKLRLGRTNHIIAEASNISVRPSRFGGTGEIVVEAPDTVWLGNQHFWVDRIRFHSNAITSLETRSSLDESDEPWEVVFEADLWSYAQDHKVEALLEELS